MIMRDYKPRKKNPPGNIIKKRVAMTAITFAAGVNSVWYALTLLAPQGLWVALALLVVGTAVTTAVTKDFLND